MYKIYTSIIHVRLYMYIVYIVGANVQYKYCTRVPGDFPVRVQHQQVSPSRPCHRGHELPPGQSTKHRT